MAADSCTQRQKEADKRDPSMQPAQDVLPKNKRQCGQPQQHAIRTRLHHVKLIGDEQADDRERRSRGPGKLAGKKVGACQGQHSAGKRRQPHGKDRIDPHVHCPVACKMEQGGSSETGTVRCKSSNRAALEARAV